MLFGTAIAHPLALIAVGAAVAALPAGPIARAEATAVRAEQPAVA